MVIKKRLLLLILLGVLTVLMGFFASKVKLSYEFSKAIPTSNRHYQDYLNFKKVFGDDGNTLVVGIISKDFFNIKTFDAYVKLSDSLKLISGVESIMSIPGAITLKKNYETEKLYPLKIFQNVNNQASLDSASADFLNLPFYRELLYNPEPKAYLLAAKIDKDILSSPARSEVIGKISNTVKEFQKATGITTYVSGLPLIRTVVADRIQAEMKKFLFGSLFLSVVILLIFFRSIRTTLLSLGVVLVSVIWTVGLIYLCGYQITLLTALIPCLVVVIGIPNCIYFINKYHSGFLKTGDKYKSLVDMVSKMGIVTLFCNIAAAIGFGVFAFTSSAILREFGVVAGIGIILIFIISFIMLPAVLSYHPEPKTSELKYLKSKWIDSFLTWIEKVVFNHKRSVLLTTTIVLAFAILGITKLKTVGYIVDDLPKTDKVYTDLKFFEKNFKGVMPLEIVVDTKKKNGLTGIKALQVFEKIDSLSTYLTSIPGMSRPLSLAEGLKFAKQGFYELDSTQYLLPNTIDGAFVGEYLKPAKKSDKKNAFNSILQSFMDSSRQKTRISVSMADVGTQKMPLIIDSIEKKVNSLFDSSKYKLTLTGTSITFLEGSHFIISGLKESIFWAFLLIALCMLYLFRSARIVFCSLIPNVIPLIVTAGVMGWVGLALKPSTVLVFSVALGIAVDITIRFLVNYKQELPLLGNDQEKTIKSTIRNTGLSIIYTSLVLIAGFIIFCASSFGGTISLGWLTSLTLIVATLTNLILLPVLIMSLSKRKSG